MLYSDGDKREDVPGGDIRILPRDAKRPASGVKHEDVKLVPGASRAQATRTEQRKAPPKDNKRKWFSPFSVFSLPRVMGEEEKQENDDRAFYADSNKAARVASLPRVKQEESTPHSESNAITPVSLPRCVSMGCRPEKLPSICSQSLVDLQLPTDPTEEGFLSAPLFHLNPFLTAGKKIRGFGPFILEGVATCGFDETNHPIVRDLVRNRAPKRQVRDAIVDYWISQGYADTSSSSAGQVASWLVDANVGSYIIMRHEVKNCPYLPNRLKDEAGNYIGPVYVLGKIVEDEPYSAKHAEVALRIAKMNGFDSKYPMYLHEFKRVHWFSMGRKDALSESTRNYINKICQPTLARICRNGKVWSSSNTNAEQVRGDLWENAQFPVNPDDFSDVKMLT